jgi:hypothetical protein
MVSHTPITSFMEMTLLRLETVIDVLHEISKKS